ncbi:uncharacterized protein UV8b_08029 [Ustilaginoidea virens]|uniref:Fungal-type protein kinase domain-containing protein n=2 Tax=Ustilaginoidea virens TaxID=1159556 RepID=A0A8E5HYD2_USTVR|nr:uncharacterized protein UV8b_08029 [Ustilaginoidea virens]QUC23788.1 hypothetical protein UV8b_08029 [Ustilaginoidea virens]
MRRRFFPTVPLPKAIQDCPIGAGLDKFRNDFSDLYEDVGNNISVEARGRLADDIKPLLALLNALQNLPACLVLSSRLGGKNLYGDLLKLAGAINADDFDLERIIPLLQAVFRKEPDDVIWKSVYAAVAESTPPPTLTLTSSIPQTPLLRTTGSFSNTTERRKHIDGVLKEELGKMHVGIPGFFEAFFGEFAGRSSAAQAAFDKCEEGDDPLFREGSGWRGWPEQAEESHVLKWLAVLLDKLLGFAEEHQPGCRTQRRPLAQPCKPLAGSTASRKLDIGFVDDPNAGVNSKCHWSHILVPGELKRNPKADNLGNAWFDIGRYAREVLAAQDSRRFVLAFTLCGPMMRLWEIDRLGGIASAPFDINKDGRQFATAMLGFLWMSQEQLGFDPTVIMAGNKRYIEIERGDRKERLVVDEVIKRVPCVAGRATTCWRVHQIDDPKTPLVVKDSWQFPERNEEGELLRLAAEKKVVNVARYFHHETVRVGGQDDDIRGNVRKGLDITKATNHKSEKQTARSSTTGRRASQRDGSSGVARRKRSSSCTGASLPPSKRSRSNTPSEPVIPNRVHRRVIVYDYGKPIYKASSLVSLLAALEGCIEGYESLHARAGLLQRDISPNNLLVNEDEENPSWPSFLIDLDVAVEEKREKASGARAKTGTWPFLAIGILYGTEQHSFMHDLESFFWVLFWICIHYDGPGNSIGPTRYEEWNYQSDRELGKLKAGTVSSERDFLKETQDYFTPYYQPLIPYVNRLRRTVFPGNNRWTKPNPNLYLEMKEVLRAAQDDLEGR